MLIHTYTHTYIYSYIRILIHTYTHTYIYSYIHMLIHTHTQDAVWILASMFDAVKDKSCVGIFDGEDISKGPISTIWLKHHLPHSLHGSFAEGKIFDKRIM